MRFVTAVAILVLLGVTHGQAEANSSHLVASDLLNQYAIIKSIVESNKRQYYLDLMDDERAAEQKFGSEGKHNLASCGGVEANMGLGLNNNLETIALARIAVHTLMWQDQLSRDGYPPALVNPLIQGVESRLLKHVSRKGGGSFQDTLRLEGEALATKLEKLKKVKKLAALDEEYMDECGGPGVEVTFKIPKGARMYVASAFYVQLCQKQGIDPSDTSACNWYEEVFDGTKNELAGLYRYQAKWSDGEMRNGQFDATRPDGENWVFSLSR